MLLKRRKFSHVGSYDSTNLEALPESAPPPPTLRPPQISKIESFATTNEQITTTVQIHHVYSTLKRRGNGRFHVVSTWNTRDVFVGRILNTLVSTYLNIEIVYSSNHNAIIPNQTTCRSIDKL